MKYIDLFGGIGGFSRGIEKATNCNWRNSKEYCKNDGFKSNSCKCNGKRWRSCSNNNWECVYYNDFDKYAVQTYNKNFGTDYEPTDITTVKEADIPDHDVICAGFPCQAFSIAGKRRGFEDTRGTLFFEIMRIAKAKGTPYLFLENVKGLLNHEKGKTFTKILQTLQELGYEYQWLVLNSKFFGVAQNRERVFIIANLRGKPRPEILPFRENATEVSELSANQEVGKIGMNWIQRGAVFNHTPHTGQAQPVPEYDRIYETEGIAPPVKRETKIYDRKGFDSRYKGFREGKISPTLTKKMGTGGNNVPMVINPKLRDYTPKPTAPTLQATHYKEPPNLVLKNKLRRLTPKECERLQGYPDNWTNGVSDTQRYKQLGNAVTVNVIAEIVKQWVKNHNVK